MHDLKFNDHSFELVECNGKTWLTAADIATALGYSRSDQVSRIFLRHEREFSQSMTMLFRNTTLGFGVQPSDVRLFSLRGAHLIGMFSRTTKGVEFRKWVLDRLDEVDRQSIPNRSLMVAWFEAKAAVDSQDRFASMCGKGLSEHKTRKPPLTERLDQIGKKLQPALNFN
ncbi:hypothetical protein C7W93_06970 [Glaciimonas sp. PCH181]|nr:hypothetical protein C7W93_06970 [Glaciimonas sp. PCH181]